ncbi:MAG: HAD family hydrolase [Promethearchaeota archaeon]|jgi:phosphoglycolate phosphatase
MKQISFEGKKIIIFDLDGTIVRLTADWKVLTKILAEKYSKLYNEICPFKSVSACLSKIVERNDEAVLNNFFGIIRQYELENIKENQNIEETIYLINNKEIFGIDQGTKLTILSLNTRKTIITSLKLAKIYGKFDFIVGREDVRKWKPDPEGLLKIQENFDVSKEEMLYFGDLEKYILTGKNAGIDAYWINDLTKLVDIKRGS